MEKKSPSITLSFEFSLQILLFAEVLKDNRKFDVSRQLLRSGTSIAANIREAQNAESRSDFLHKIKISAKEAEESEYWLELCTTSEIYPTPPEKMMFQIKSIQKILNKIIYTTKQRMKTK